MRVQHKPQVDVLSDEFMASPDTYKSMSDWMDVDPVDANGGFVPLDRDAKDNLQNAQENVQRRFNLGQTPWGADPFIEQKSSGGSFSVGGNSFNNKIRK